MAAKSWPEVWCEMTRAGVNIGKKSPELQPKTGSISGSSLLHSANWPNMRGVLTIEAGLQAGSKLRLSGWRKEPDGGQCLSLGGEIATRAERRRGTMQTERWPAALRHDQDGGIFRGGTFRAVCPVKPDPIPCHWSDRS